MLTRRNSSLHLALFGTALLALAAACSEDTLPGLDVTLVPSPTNAPTPRVSPTPTPTADSTPSTRATVTPTTDENVNSGLTPTLGPTPTPTPAPAGSRLPDLVATTPRGWSDSIVINSDPGKSRDGPVSVDVPTNINIALTNAGLASALEPIVVDVEIDGRFVTSWQWPYARTRQILRADWTEQLGLLAFDPGEYIVRFIIDPNNTVFETDETNNTFELAFTWESGPLQDITPAPSPGPWGPSILTLPNLAPGWEFQTDFPLVVSRSGGANTSGPLLAGEPVFIDIAVTNASVQDAPPFLADIYFDDARVHTIEAESGLRGGFVNRWEDWAGLPLVTTPGLHTVKVIIDPIGRVEEANENDNTFQATFEWVAQQPLAPSPRQYTQVQLVQMLAGLDTWLAGSVTVSDDPAAMNAVLRAADAGYFSITGRSLLDEDARILLLPHDQYLAWTDAFYADKLAISGASERAFWIGQHEIFTTEVVGLKSRFQGRINLVVDAERTFDQVLSSLAHEAGHLLQDIRNPAQTETFSSFRMRGLHEAQAQYFERVFWLKVDEITGVDHMQHPRHEALENLIDFRFRAWFDNRARGQHDLGYLIAWMTVLSEPKLDHLAAELKSEGSLSAASAIELFEFLVALEPSKVQPYVGTFLLDVDPTLWDFREISKSRLVTDLLAELEGPAGVRISALMMP